MAGRKRKADEAVVGGDGGDGGVGAAAEAPAGSVLTEEQLDRCVAAKTAHPTAFPQRESA